MIVFLIGLRSGQRPEPTSLEVQTNLAESIFYFFSTALEHKAAHQRETYAKMRVPALVII